jgi:hypothetical protein
MALPFRLGSENPVRNLWAKARKPVTSVSFHELIINMLFIWAKARCGSFSFYPKPEGLGY